MKPRIAVHKFSSCDGCQLAFINLGEDLVRLSQQVEIIHFAEAGYLDESAHVDIAFVEGSLSTPHEIERIHQVRENSDYLITIGACATSGGLQALRNLADNSADWVPAVYARPEYIATLDKVKPIAKEVKVDLELWGCPVNSRQVMAAVTSLLLGVSPRDDREKLCMECKRKQAVCVMVTKDMPCLGPVTRAGCGAVCPSFERDCYGCFGPAERPNTTSLGQRLAGLGLVPDELVRRFWQINSGAPAFLMAGAAWKEKDDE